MCDENSLSERLETSLLLVVERPPENSEFSLLGLNDIGQSKLERKSTNMPMLPSTDPQQDSETMPILKFRILLLYPLSRLSISDHHMIP